MALMLWISVGRMILQAATYGQVSFNVVHLCGGIKLAIQCRCLGLTSCYTVLLNVKENCTRKVIYCTASPGPPLDGATCTFAMSDPMLNIKHSDMTFIQLEG